MSFHSVVKIHLLLKQNNVSESQAQGERAFSWRVERLISIQSNLPNTGDTRLTRIVEVLLDSFKHEAKQARVVIDTARKVKSGFKPSESLKPLEELLNHLVEIPTLDPRFYSGEIESVEDAQKMEKDLWRKDIDDALALFDEGVKGVIERFREMTDEQLLEENLQSFYEKGPQHSWAYYIPEITRHIAMHKMQLWMYIKLSGLDVDMMIYYGIASE